MKLRKLSIVAPAGIECEFAVPDSGVEGDGHVLVVAFRGEYPTGSLGNAHGHFIARKTLEGLAAFGPASLVLDLSQLRYQWGNTLLLVFQEVSRYMDEEGEPVFPVVLVASDQSRPALRSLLGNVQGVMFDTLDHAVAIARAQGQEWLDS